MSTVDPPRSWTADELESAEEAAQRHLVGAVVSSWNRFQVSGRTVITHGDGCRVWDVDGHECIDWIMGWGSLVLGHRPSAVYEGLDEAKRVGFGYMYESPRTGLLARRLSELIPCAERMRLANSGTEATLHAIRIARAVTGRHRILKFEGHFHGLNDYLLFGVDGGKRLGEIGPDGLVEPVQGSGGLPVQALSSLVLVAPFNNLDVLESAFRRYGGEIAAVIMEPVALNAGCIAPDPGFLDAVRRMTRDAGSLLIFDEVLTGFRVARGGAQEYFGVRPDLACFGKALGCGVPVAAVCGTAELMDVLTPVGDVEMAGTNTGRQLAVSGSLAALQAMEATGAWNRLREANDRFVGGCRELMQRYGVPAHVEGFGGRIGIHIGSEERPRNFRDVVRLWNRNYHVALYRQLHDARNLFGFLLALGPCPEAVTLSAVHTDDDLDETLARLETALKNCPYRAA
ncbi:MAG TPA: aspartate aminotransferase family protein [Vicinamibacterales bacterium]|nr:aspartate aminotransferase family protein [Vicinamibacterales bacterium]